MVFAKTVANPAPHYLSNRPPPHHLSQRAAADSFPHYPCRLPPTFAPPSSPGGRRHHHHLLSPGSPAASPSSPLPAPAPPLPHPPLPAPADAFPSLLSLRSRPPLPDPPLPASADTSPPLPAPADASPSLSNQFIFCSLDLIEKGEPEYEQGGNCCSYGPYSYRNCCSLLR